MSKKRVLSEEIMLQVRTGRLTTAGLCGTPTARSGSPSSQIPGGSTVDGERRINQATRRTGLEQETARLKRIVANPAVDRSILKEGASGNF